MRRMMRLAQRLERSRAELRAAIARMPANPEPLPVTTKAIVSDRLGVLTENRDGSFSFLAPRIDENGRPVAYVEVEPEDAEKVLAETRTIMNGEHLSAIGYDAFVRWCRRHLITSEAAASSLLDVMD